MAWDPFRGGNQPADERPSLTAREIDVLRLVAKGRTSKEIGLDLSISIKTVEAHRSRILWKLHASGVVELVHYAIKNGLIEVNKE
jgi:DNA-binding NarL/FixJ family response regulator